MKKVFYALCSLLLLTGCGEKITNEIMNTPTKKVEALLNKYQKLDDDVLNDLDNIIDETENLTTEERDKYRDVMKKHYESLSYKVKDETIDGDNAVVTVEIEVIDHTKSYQNTNNTDNDNNDNDDNNNNDNDNIIEDIADSFEDILDKMTKDKDTITYTLELSVTKYDDEWVVDPLSDDDIKKIHGIYVD